MGWLLALFVLTAPAAAADGGLTSIDLACVYTDGTKGPLQLSIIDNGERVLVRDGLYRWRGPSDPYQITAALDPDEGDQLREGMIKINRSTGLVQMVFVMNGTPMAQHARCEPAKPKF